MSATAVQPLQQLHPLEAHSGMLFGPRDTPLPPEPPPLPGGPRAVLEAILLDALHDGPCHVLFSGGRDSSVILAAATDVARRHGLPDPIALTARFAGHPATWEDEWQERTMRHLRLAEWRRFEVSTELDTLGPLAAENIRRFGVYLPSNAHNMRHFARQAGAGTLLTGGGGDELFTPWSLRRLPLRRVARLRPYRRAARRIALHSLPGPLRRRRIAAGHRAVLRCPWLHADVEAELQARYDRSRGTPPRRWSDAVERMLGGRYMELVRAALDAFAAAEGVRLVEPFYDRRVVRAVAARAPREGYPDRGLALETLFSDLLPRDVLHRSTKAHFTEVAWGPAARAFAAEWDGTGLDPALVDPDRLRAEWAKPRPHSGSVACLHLAWHSAQARA